MKHSLETGSHAYFLLVLVLSGLGTHRKIWQCFWKDDLGLYATAMISCDCQSSVFQDVVTSICFGRYGREDGTLIMTTKGTDHLFI